MVDTLRDDKSEEFEERSGLSKAGDLGGSILRKIRSENGEDKWSKIALVLSRAITPTKLSLLFLVLCWLLLRFVYIRSGATLDVGQLIGFSSSIFSIVVMFYVILILTKFAMFICLMRDSRSCIVSWVMFGVIVLFCMASFDGFMLAGASIYSLAAENTTTAVNELKLLLEDFKFIPAAPIVVAIFATVVPWDEMPKIKALDPPFVASVCIGVTVLGFYSFFWKFLPKHLSLGGILFGAIGAGVLIFYIATPAAQSSAVHGKLLIRVMITIILTCVLLALYMDYWKKAAQEFLYGSIPDADKEEMAASTRDADSDTEGSERSTDSTEAQVSEEQEDPTAAPENVRGYEDSDVGLLQKAANRDLSLIYLPPGHTEVGLWVFFGLVVVGDALGAR